MPKPEEKKDDITWFGTKVGSEASALDFGAKANSGVGKYLNLKRPQTAMTSSGGGGGTEESKKKRKIGFGDFDGW